MQNTLLTPTSLFTFSGVQLPLTSWNVRMASHGSLGTIEACTSATQLAAAGIDLPSLNGATLSLSAGYKETETTLIFGGYFDCSEGNLKSAKISLKGRDWAADLADKKQVLAGFNLKNQTIGQIVTQIALSVGLTPNVTDPGILAGATYKNDTALLMHPQPLWSVLKHYADQVGYEVKVTPDKTLFFGPIDLDAGSLDVTWFTSPGVNSQNALLDFSWRHSPRRNGNFEVHVLSYDPYTNQLTSGQKTVTTDQINGQPDKKHAFHNHHHHASHSTGISKSGGIGSAGGASQKVLLTFHADGLTAAQCAARAAGIAADISKRQVVAQGVIKGQPLAAVHQQLKINALAPMLGFENLQYTITEVSHSFSMHEGFKTEFSALVYAGEFE